jgi:hypothetical protein
MAKSTGIILVAGGITFANEWLNNKINWRIVPATLGTAVVFAGIEKLSEPAAVGLATIALISVLIGGITPGVPSPAVQILDTLGYGGTKK